MLCSVTAHHRKKKLLAPNLVVVDHIVALPHPGPLDDRLLAGSFLIVALDETIVGAYIVSITSKCFSWLPSSTDRLAIALRFTISSLQIELFVVPVRFSRMYSTNKYNTSLQAYLLDYGIGDTFVSFGIAAVC